MAKNSNKVKKNTNKENNFKLLAENRYARFQYAISETIEAGIELLGTEVKSIRNGKANLRDGYCSFRDGEIFLLNVHISPCLLYTSPSPRDLSTSRMPSSA